jgi:cytochrome bd-type quinol oxidase subunit 2
VSLLRNHVVLMAIFALLTGAFFALLWKSETRDRVRAFALVTGGLFLGGLALAWAMFPFPG